MKLDVSLLTASEPCLPTYLGYEGCSVKVQALSPVRRGFFTHRATQHLLPHPGNTHAPALVIPHIALAIGNEAWLGFSTEYD